MNGSSFAGGARLAGGMWRSRQPQPAARPRPGGRPRSLPPPLSHLEPQGPTPVPLPAPLRHRPLPPSAEVKGPGSELTSPQPGGPRAQRGRGCVQVTAVSRLQSLEHRATCWVRGQPKTSAGRWPAGGGTGSEAPWHEAQDPTPTSGARLLAECSALPGSPGLRSFPGAKRSGTEQEPESGASLLPQGPNGPSTGPVRHALPPALLTRPASKGSRGFV